MNNQRRRLRGFAIAAVTVVAAACGSAARDDVAVGARDASSPPIAAPVVATGAMPHGDHNPHHGGVVMMKGDLHYEVVLDPRGRAHHVYFTDATRQDLPASIASAVSLTIRRANAADESIPLAIDGAGESWIGSGRPVSDPASTTARVAFTLKNEAPYWIDLPFPAGR